MPMPAPPPPVEVLETANVNWDDSAKLAVCCDFLQVMGIAHPEIIASFRRYVAQRAEEDKARLKNPST
jgi:hypothetical protein